MKFNFIMSIFKNKVWNLYLSKNSPQMSNEKFLYIYREEIIVRYIIYNLRN